MSLKLPYNKMTLQVAFYKASHKLDDYVSKNSEEKAVEVSKSCTVNFSNNAELNQLVAGSHGITVSELINSPNYSVLKDEFVNAKIDEARIKLKEAFGLDEVESWAFILAEQLGFV